MLRYHRPGSLFCLVILGACLLPTRCQCAEVPRKTLVIVVEGISRSEMISGSLPNLSRCTQLGLMNCAVAGQQTPLAAIMTLATGRYVAVESTDMEIYDPGDPIENATAGVVYERRMGMKPGLGLRLGERNDPPMLHLGWASLQKRKITTELLGVALSDRSSIDLPIALIEANQPANRRGALFSVGSNGIAKRCMTLTRSSPAEIVSALTVFAKAITKCGIVHFPYYPGDTPKTLHILDELIKSLPLRGFGENLRVLIVSAFPEAAQSGNWDRLAPVLMFDSAAVPGVLTSRTTRTPGLISNLDIAPTILSWCGVSVPSGMAGHVIQIAPANGRAAVIVSELDHQVYVDGVSSVPASLALIILGAAAACIIVLALTNGPCAPIYGEWLCMAFLCMPLSMLVAIVIRHISPNIGLIGSTLGIPVVMTFMAGLFHLSLQKARDVGGLSAKGDRAIIWLAGITVAVVTLDTVFHWNFVGHTLMSAYYLQGIRFYGIGNEYMGFIISMSLLWAGLKGIGRGWSLGVFLAVTLLVGMPTLGANAGGLITAVTAFGIALWPGCGRALGLIRAAVLMVIGLVSSFALAGIDRLWYGPSASHMGRALAAGHDQGFGYILEIVERKVMMNYRISTSWSGLLAVIGGVGLFLVVRRFCKPHIIQLGKRHPKYFSYVDAAGWGALAAFIFNDSGLVASIFLLGSYLLAGVYLMLNIEYNRASHCLRTVD